MAQRWQVRQALAALVVVVLPACAPAAWLGYKNDTPTAVVLQSASVINNQVRLGKAHLLFPGEIAWDAVTAPGLRRLMVYDPKQKNRLLHQDVVNCQQLDIFLSLQVVVPPPQKGQPPPQAQLRFLPIKPPVMPGITRPPAGSSPGTPTVPGPRPGFTPPANPPRPPTAPPPTPPKDGGR